jgi:predicted RNA-binding Zn ribbon-like protein
MSSLLARYPGALAPDELSLVQELVNTRGIHGKVADLLADLATAQPWVDAALAQWAERAGAPAPRIALRASDLERLRSLRVETAALVAGGRAVSPDAAVQVRIGESGEARLYPVGSGIEWMRSAVFAQVATAQSADTWRRLKLCRNPECASAFYDRSRNNSGVWHDVHTCGNSANLRASRARRRAASAT